MKVTDPNTIAAVIEALGGCAQTAKLFGVTKSAVSQWRHKGIPKARVLTIQYARPDVYVLLQTINLCKSQ